MTSHREISLQNGGNQSSHSLSDRFVIKLSQKNRGKNYKKRSRISPDLQFKYFLLTKQKT